MKKNGLIEDLINYGIKDMRILKAFEVVKREDFIEASLRDLSESDTPLPIGFNQTISQPFIVAYMLEALDLKQSDSVLEIGTGSGYQTALIAKLVKAVTSIERIGALKETAEKNLKKYGFKNITLIDGDGATGYAKHAPYEKIIVACASKNLPPKLSEQLNINGKLIMPLGGEVYQTLTLFEKTSNGLKKTPLLGCRFVPLISKTTSSF
ncbi:MAG: protein-L-isoaspartate(D-aspartate) O-methyltransferase [Candidatus Izemoplasmataceae bacterium]